MVRAVPHDGTTVGDLPVAPTVLYRATVTSRNSRAADGRAPPPRSMASAGRADAPNVRLSQYLLSSATSLPWIDTRSGPKMRVS